jgi:hypothetical protein
VPSGAVLSAGRDNGDGTWTLTPEELTGLTITPAPDSDADFTLTVTATSVHGESTASTVAELAVTVEAVSDAPVLEVSAGHGAEDTAIPLAIEAALAGRPFRGTGDHHRRTARRRRSLGGNGQRRRHLDARPG